MYTSELILCFTICVHSATRHNIHMYPDFSLDEWTMDSSDKSIIKGVEIYTYTDCKRKYSATTTTAWLQAIRETYASPIYFSQ